MCAGVLLLVVLFRTSNALADAYGFAVVGTMLTTTILVFSVMRHVWHWPRPLVVALISPFLIVDLVFFTTATTKIPDGGWLPLTIGAAIFTIFMTWRQGRALVLGGRHDHGRKLTNFLNSITPDRPTRVSGTAVYLSRLRAVMPMALTSNLHHNKVLHKHVIVMTVMTEAEPRVPKAGRVTIKAFGKGVWQVLLHYGFMERPNVARDIQLYLPAELEVNKDDTSFFIGRDIYVAGGNSLTPPWRKNLFLWLSNHAAEASEYYRIPPEQAVEFGVQIAV